MRPPFSTFSFKFCQKCYVRILIVGTSLWVFYIQNDGSNMAAIIGKTYKWAKLLVDAWDWPMWGFQDDWLRICTQSLKIKKAFPI